MLAFKGSRGGDLLTISNEREVFSPPVRHTGCYDHEAEHADSKVTKNEVCTGQHVAQYALERWEAHEEEHDSECEDDWRP